MSKLPAVGDIFESRYRIESVIGKGGFGKVYLASQTDLTRKVALKVMREPASRYEDDDSGPSMSDMSGDFAVRFEQEANLVSQLRDPHTVRMFDFGKTEAGLLYMVLEYIDGESLHSLLKREGAVSPERAVKIMRQVLSSLHEAHSLGVMHRDVKPGNIMLYEHVGRTDQVKVLDFGLAKAVGKSGPITESDLTHSGILIGTPRYMSPEQLRGEKLTGASDLYSVGLVAYEMLVGTKAVVADTPMVIVSHHLAPGSFSLPPEVEAPGRLREIINRLLHKNATMRYASAAEVLEALEDWDGEAHDPEPTFSLPMPGGDAPRASEPESSRVGIAIFAVCVVIAVLLAINIVTQPPIESEASGAETPPLGTRLEAPLSSNDALESDEAEQVEIGEADDYDMGSAGEMIADSDRNSPAADSTGGAPDAGGAKAFGNLGPGVPDGGAVVPSNVEPDPKDAPSQRKKRAAERREKERRTRRTEEPQKLNVAPLE